MPAFATLASHPIAWIVSYPVNGSEVLVTSGEMVTQGQRIVEIKEEDLALIDISHLVYGWTEPKKQILREQLEGKPELLHHLFGKKVTIPEQGVVTGLDEFMRVQIRTGVFRERTLYSPVSARVGELKPGTMRLHFQAWEFPISGTGMAKVWGNGDFRLLQRINDLHFSQEGQLVFCSRIDRAMVAKAAAVGVKGIVVVGNDMNLNLEGLLPMAFLSSAAFQELEHTIKPQTTYRLLLNIKACRLMVVVQ